MGSSKTHEMQRGGTPLAPVSHTGLCINCRLAGPAFERLLSTLQRFNVKESNMTHTLTLG